VGPSRVVRFQEQGWRAAAGILAISRRLQTRRKAADAGELLREELLNLHRYNAPSYLTGMGSSPMQAVSEGYLTMLPDILFRTGASHSDMLECVEAAVRKVIEMGTSIPSGSGSMAIAMAAKARPSSARDRGCLPRLGWAPA